MELNKEIIDYISSQVFAGKTEEQIISTLIEQGGWSEEVARKATLQVMATSPNNSSPPQAVTSSETPSQTSDSRGLKKGLVIGVIALLVFGGSVLGYFVYISQTEDAPNKIADDSQSVDEGGLPIFDQEKQNEEAMNDPKVDTDDVVTNTQKVSALKNINSYGFSIQVSTDWVLSYDGDFEGLPDVYSKGALSEAQRNIISLPLQIPDEGLDVPLLVIYSAAIPYAPTQFDLGDPSTISDRVFPYMENQISMNVVEETSEYLIILKEDSTHKSLTKHYYTIAPSSVPTASIYAWAEISYLSPKNTFEMKTAEEIFGRTSFMDSLEEKIQEAIARQDRYSKIGTENEIARLLGSLEVSAVLLEDETGSYNSVCQNNALHNSFAEIEGEITAKGATMKCASNTSSYAFEVELNGEIRCIDTWGEISDSRLDVQSVECR